MILFSTHAYFILVTFREVQNYDTLTARAARTATTAATATARNSARAARTAGCAAR
jgi:hypothetical protein